jgi:drug/metabolite transporter (DMT)-like permease
MTRSDKNGILYMLGASFLLSVTSLYTSILSSKINIFTLFFIVSIIGFIISGSLQLVLNKSFYTTTKFYYIIRGFFACLTFLFWGYVLKTILLNNAMAISYITPLLNIFAAVILFKEKLTKKMLLWSITGFIGAVIVLKPSFSKYNLGYLLAILTSFLWMISDVLAKMQVKADPPLLHCFYLYLFIMLFAAPSGIYYYIPVSSDIYLKIIFLGVFQFLNIFFFLQAYYKADMVIVTPYDFTRIIVTSILSYFILNQKLDIYILIGTIIILFSVVNLTRIKR